MYINIAKTNPIDKRPPPPPGFSVLQESDPEMIFMYIFIICSKSPTSNSATVAFLSWGSCLLGRIFAGNGIYSGIFAQEVCYFCDLTQILYIYYNICICILHKVWWNFCKKVFFKENSINLFLIKATFFFYFQFFSASQNLAYIDSCFFIYDFDVQFQSFQVLNYLCGQNFKKSNFHSRFLTVWRHLIYRAHVKFCPIYISIYISPQNWNIKDTLYGVIFYISLLD